MSNSKKSKGEQNRSGGFKGFVIVFLVVGLAAAALIPYLSGVFGSNQLAEAYKYCNEKFTDSKGGKPVAYQYSSSEVDKYYEDLKNYKSYASLELTDGGKTLIINEDDDDYSDKRLCVYDKVKMPERTRTSIGKTRALDGTKTDSWDDLNAEWTYNGSSGKLYIMIYKK